MSWYYDCCCCSHPALWLDLCGMQSSRCVFWGLGLFFTLFSHPITTLCSFKFLWWVANVEKQWCRWEVWNLRAYGPGELTRKIQFPPVKKLHPVSVCDELSVLFSGTSIPCAHVCTGVWWSVKGVRGEKGLQLGFGCQKKNNEQPQPKGELTGTCHKTG